MKRSSPCIAMLTGILFVAGSGLLSVVRAETPANPGCNLTLPSFTSSAPNIFNDQQEQYLGDALAEYFESDMKIAPPGKDDQLTRIGERLLATLPPTGVHYRFRIYDSGEVNGFSIAGGRVYISRKLIAAVKNEDELAGVLAHEIGHISTHQSAIEFTRMLRIRLGITQVTDREDVFAKVHRMFNTPAKPEEEQDKEKVDQLIADRVALFAMVGAGYAPESFASFLNESMMNKGKTGNWLSDAFGLTHEASQRYRSALKLISVLPAGCKGVVPANPASFAAWQHTTVEERPQAVAEGAVGDRPIQLEAPLRPSLWRIRFSPDGRYLLAQDEGSISVLDRLAAKVLFRIEAPDVEAAQFTPESDAVVFHNSKLRVERWNIATRQRDRVKEMVVYDGCDQTLLAPDGKTLVCARLTISDDSAKVGLRFIDVESGQVLLDKPSFFLVGVFNQPGRTFALAEDSMLRLNFIKLLLSPDGHSLLAAVYEHTMAYDLKARQAIALGGKLQTLQEARVSFLGPDQMYLIGEPIGKSMYKTHIVSFPDGRSLEEGEIGPQYVQATAKGRTLIAGPLKDYVAGILDPEKHLFVAESKFEAIDAWDSYAAMEGKSGDVFVVETNRAVAANDATPAPAASKAASSVPAAPASGPASPSLPPEIIPLPMGPLPTPRAAVFSSDGKYLTVSLKHRSEIWEIETGKKVGLFRPFRNAYFDPNDHLFAQFPKYLDKDPSEMEIQVSPLGGHDLTKLNDADWENSWQYHQHQIRMKPMGKDKATDHHVTLMVKRMDAEAVVWSRDFPHEAPACWPTEDNRMILAWDLSNDTAKGEIKSHPELQRQASALKNQKKGLLLETVALETGAPIEQVILPEADLTHGSDDGRRASISGNFVLARGEHSNTAIYRLSDGFKVGEFFGSALATDAKSDLIAATNREDEILLVEEHSGKELQRFTLGSPIRLAHIVSGKQLLVLTADQVVHRLPLPSTLNVAVK